MTDALSLVAVNIGSTRVAVARLDAGAPGAPDLLDAADTRAVRDAISAAARGSADDSPAAGVIVASVNPRAEGPLLDALASSAGVAVYRLGRDLPIPQPHSLGPDHTTGQDRLLNALAAFDLFKEACAVIDAGTAVTVDFVDGQGVFHGGVIAPGGRMQLRALHEGTASLPAVALAAPDDDAGAFARTTPEAMLHGVFFGVRGLVRAAVERFAEEFGAYPRVVATGGDAALFFDADEFVERVVPDLTLRGIALAASAALAEAPDNDA